MLMRCFWVTTGKFPVIPPLCNYYFASISVIYNPGQMETRFYFLNDIIKPAAVLVFGRVLYYHNHIQILLTLNINLWEAFFI